jgi:hypothetical protein
LAGILAFVSRRYPAAKPEKFVAYREGGLKGRLQPRLPAARKAKAESRPPGMVPQTIYAVN